MALNKSTSFKALLKHTSVYSLVVGIAFLPILSGNILLFTLVTFILHTLIDFFTSVVVSDRFKKRYLGGPIPNMGAFTMIGLDQVMHYIILLYTLQFFL